MIEVYITDDHKMLVEGLTNIVNESGFAKVIGTFLNIEDCRKSLIIKQLNVLLLDISLPDGDGIEFCKEVCTTYPDVKVLAITSHDEYSVARRMLGNGATGYILKNSSGEEMLEGIKTVNEGRKYICDEMETIIRQGTDNEVFLTLSEKKVLKLIVEGYTNPEIAEQLFLSPLTVKGYRKSLLLKLAVHNTAALVKVAIQEKLI